MCPFFQQQSSRFSIQTRLNGSGRSLVCNMGEHSFHVAECPVFSNSVILSRLFWRFHRYFEGFTAILVVVSGLWISLGYFWVQDSFPGICVTGISRGSRKLCGSTWTESDDFRQCHWIPCTVVIPVQEGTRPSINSGRNYSDGGCEFVVLVI